MTCNEVFNKPSSHHTPVIELENDGLKGAGPRMSQGDDSAPNRREIQLERKINTCADSEVS